MKRMDGNPRQDWQSKVEQSGLIWHSVGKNPYWDESAYYEFTSPQIDQIEMATANLYEMFLEAGEAILGDKDGLRLFGIPEYCHQAIKSAWNDEPPALNYGRFDLGYDGVSPPKLFEFNCDTPTSLLEAAVIQWGWKEDVFPQNDQFNSLHDKLVGKWTDIRPLLNGQQVHFVHAKDQSGEDAVTTAYLRDCAALAGIDTNTLTIDLVGWDHVSRRFVDCQNKPMDTIYKLYPWEWLVNESFGERLIANMDKTLWIEPIWKMIWSNKAILPVLWSMFPDHPNLLPAYYSPNGERYVKKPRLAREGANIQIINGNDIIADTGGEYGEEGYVYQDVYNLPGSDDRRPVIGSWIVDGVPAGMGIREDGLITSNTARFVPHIIRN